MTGYGQFCPIAKTMEVLDERWTILVIRELLAGSHHFNDLRRGVPKMSPTLLSKRLRGLVRIGLVMRIGDGTRSRYELTPAGRELAPIVMALGNWGVRWMTQLGEEDLDPHLLMWDVHRNIDLATVPDGRTVLEFHFSDVGAHTSNWWVVINGQHEVDLCDFDPGYEVVVTATSTLRTMVLIWRGDLSWRAALNNGSLTLEGSSHVRNALPHWLKLSPFAASPRVLPQADAAR
ncbi:winged helix-turn-helix transcriptional regulator [Tomitella biformata]|uniref:winged helix-turn-helix transcriptional regulator n=1 Tax=Tomitella biformata TaxID=630403 RepID=UPI0004B573CC|nr:helix-turn-helix domain-containing protein [Tomitella biformata]